MKILTIGFLILVMMSGQLNADENTPPNKITLNLDSTSEVSVEGFIAPIAFTVDNFHVNWDTLANLKVAEPEKRYAASVFNAFLPHQPVSVGELWQVKPEGILELLKQLHPNPYVEMHGPVDSSGLWATLRAYNDLFAEIVFRIHAEFALEDGWFTPSQFAGRLVIDRPQAKVAFFEMYVPEGTLNFDVNRKHENSHYFGTDAGFCPQIGLFAGTQAITSDTQFTEAITQEATERKLIHRFYKSEQIKWVAMDKALEIARSLQKPIHVVSIDGPLTDEAC